MSLSHQTCLSRCIALISLYRVETEAGEVEELTLRRHTGTNVYSGVHGDSNPSSSAVSPPRHPLQFLLVPHLAFFQGLRLSSAFHHPQTLVFALHSAWNCPPSLPSLHRAGPCLFPGPCLVLLPLHPLPSWPQTECGMRQKRHLARSQADRAFLCELEMLLELCEP